MSETIAMPPLGDIETRHVPTVYFIDDSATMREVIKIAFRRESIHVITCADAASALSQFEEYPPDVVITDVIMPDQDGYSVCSHIKQNPQYGKTPVILMSGVVNKSVADRAVAVQADELVRKPFQPQELIRQSEKSPGPRKSITASISWRRNVPQAVPSLSSLFAPPPPPQVQPKIVPPPQQLPSAPMLEPKSTESVWPRALAEAFLQQNQAASPTSSASKHPAWSASCVTPMPKHKNCAPKSPGSTCSSRNCRQSCKSSGNTIRRWNFMSAACFKSTNNRSQRSLKILAWPCVQLTSFFKLVSLTLRSNSFSEYRRLHGRMTKRSSCLVVHSPARGALLRFCSVPSLKACFVPRHADAAIAAQLPDNLPKLRPKGRQKQKHASTRA